MGMTRLNDAARRSFGEYRRTDSLDALHAAVSGFARAATHSRRIFLH